MKVKTSIKAGALANDQNTIVNPGGPRLVSGP